MKRFRVIYPFLAVAFILVFFTAGCATKGFVNQEIATLDREMQELKGAVEDNQQEITNAKTEINTVKQDTETLKVETAKAMDLAKGKLLYSVTLSSDQTRFQLGKAELSDQAKAIIDDLFNRLVRDNQNVYIEIEGHTCNIGSRKRNYELGLMRADAVKKYVVDHYNIPLHKINVISYAFDKPIADNATRTGREQNRRVVIRVLE